jgi:intracellular protein transport protein USO1
LIRGNAPIQEQFAQHQVPSVSEVKAQLSNGDKQQNELTQVYVIDGLLDLALTMSSNQAFDARMAACECIEAYFYNHTAIRMHFLRRAITGHMSDEGDETANVLSTILIPPESGRISDPYRVWLASVLCLHLIFEDPDAKTLLSEGVKEGDAEAGEEVITCIESLTGAFLAAIQRNDDDRVAVGYLMLLCGWLYEDPDAVNEFLSEGSSVQSIVQAVSHAGGEEAVLVQGLCAILLGIAYEFSTKDSPIPRGTLHPILASRLGRDLYINKITKLREHPYLRDFEVLPQRLGPSTGLPEVYFDKAFVDFLKDNSSRLIRAIDKDPGIEMPVVANGVQKGISRELVDSLRTQLEDKEKASQKAEGDIISLEQRLSQEQSAHRKSRETSAMELNKTRNESEEFKRFHNEDVRRLQAQHQSSLTSLQQQHQSTVEALEIRAVQIQREADDAASKYSQRYDAEIADLKKSLAKMESDLEKANKNHIQDLQTAHEEHSTKESDLSLRLERAERRAEDAESRTKRIMDRAKEAEERASKTEDARKALDEEKSGIQTELDDMLMVMSDLEEKRLQDKVSRECVL